MRRVVYAGFDGAADGGMMHIEIPQREYLDIRTEIAIARHGNIRELTDVKTDVAVARFEYSIPAKRIPRIHEGDE